MPNQLKRDPTRTTLLRRKCVADMTRRFKKVGRAIQELIVKGDALGLVTSQPMTFLQERQVWRFRSDANKVKAYRAWLQQQIDAEILAPVGGISDKPWLAPYVESSYKKGALRAYIDTHAEALAEGIDFYEGGKAEFLRQAFGAPEALHKIELLYTRAFDELKGVTDAMGQQMSRTLASGLAQGKGINAIARDLRLNVSNITKARANVIARTEIVRAHAEGQLDSFELLGVKELGLMAEWSTAGDDRVCAQCESLEMGGPYTVKEARDMLPAHPNCRCAWIPYLKGITKKEKEVKRKEIVEKIQLITDEKKAIQLWTDAEGEYYKDIIAWDRNHSKGPGYLERVPYWHRQLRNAMKKIGTSKKKVYRGMGLFDDEMKMFIPGKTIKNTQLAAYSGKQDKALDFARDTWKKHKILLEADLKSGIDISAYTDLKEAEYLLPKNVTLDVISTEKIVVEGDEFVKIILKEI